MRIAGGEFRGRQLHVPKGLDVRPTQDRVREALFSMLQGAVEGARFLDLFAGSGGVGFEALSRGAAAATFVESAPASLDCIALNAAMLKVEARCRIVRADVYAWLSTASYVPDRTKGLNSPSAINGLGFDIAYADPPYAVGAEHGYADMLARLSAGGIVRPGGLFVAEMRNCQAPDISPGWELCRDRTYGQTRLAVYRLQDLAVAAEEAQ
ncbi:MAG: 16S rRNA (guanine(966)-N(2))-methyltransferase RsmD [Kiritimatiellae bacterium]|nr:16S rRNA (guanine(966)-N(2))-methyltransferase RsmD [Kiritimatiellia bacterium]